MYCISSNEKLEHFLHEVEGVIEVDEYICKLPIVSCINLLYGTVNNSHCQIAKLREDRSKILEKNESQASMYNNLHGTCHTSVNNCVLGHNLSFEPQLEKAWDELQEKVGACVYLHTCNELFIILL